MLQILHIIYIRYIFCIPRLRAQLFMYHHLHASLLVEDLLQNAVGKSGSSCFMAKGIVPVEPTGTSGRSSNVEDT